MKRSVVVAVDDQRVPHDAAAAVSVVAWVADSLRPDPSRPTRNERPAYFLTIDRLAGEICSC